MGQNPNGRLSAVRTGPRPHRMVEVAPRATVLLVEDSAIIGSILARSIQTLERCSVVRAASLGEATAVFDRDGAQFTAAVIDLDLPDAPHGETVDLAIAAGVPTIVLTGNYDEATRERILEKNVVDYFIKKGDKSLAALNEALHRLRTNPGVKVLVVDDSSGFRLLIKRLLELHRFTVFEASDGVEALAVLDANPDLTLVITDFEMPHMDGLELVGKLRDRRARDELAIIGVSALGARTLPARYLKFGADDFLHKPFQKEEFYCRVYHSVANIEQIRRIQRAAFTDQLTGMSNRLHFFTLAPDLYRRTVENREAIALAMVDIDFFKRINDTYGHAGGDVVLQHLAELLDHNLAGAHVMARFGGEEFCILAPGVAGDQAAAMFEGLRAAVEATPVDFEGRSIRFTLSVGVAVTAEETLDATINKADALLYRAKESGRNQVVIEQVPAS